MGNNEIISVWVCRNVIFSPERYQVPKMTISTDRREEIVSIFRARLNFTMWLLLLCASEHATDEIRPIIDLESLAGGKKTKKPRDDGLFGTGNDATSILMLPSSKERSWRSHVVSCAFGALPALRFFAEDIRNDTQGFRGFAAALVSLPLSFGRRQLRILLVGVLFCISCFYCQMNMFKANDSE